MPFVVEPIESSVASRFDKKLLGPIFAFQPTQVIDRDQDLVLLVLGGNGGFDKESGQPPSYFNLMWQGLPIAFQGFHSENEVAGTWTVHLELDTFLVPEQLRNVFDEIKNEVTTSISVYWSHRRRRVVHADVQFPLASFY